MSVAGSHRARDSVCAALAGTASRTLEMSVIPVANRGDAGVAAYVLSHPCDFLVIGGIIEIDCEAPWVIRLTRIGSLRSLATSNDSFLFGDGAIRTGDGRGTVGN